MLAAADLQSALQLIQGTAEESAAATAHQLQVQVQQAAAAEAAAEAAAQIPQQQTKMELAEQLVLLL
jgi:hypothetical protein